MAGGESHRKKTPEGVSCCTTAEYTTDLVTGYA